LELSRVSTITCTPSFSSIAKPAAAPSGISTTTSNPRRLKKSRVGSTRSAKTTQVARDIFMK
jgi:hypothetical protein